MREIIEIYTKSKTFNNISEIMKEINYIRTQIDDRTHEDFARYICENPNGNNILVELEVSTKWCRDNDIDDYIEIVAYEFDGDIEDYMATREIKTIQFNGNYKTAIDQMKSLALNIIGK